MNYLYPVIAQVSHAAESQPEFSFSIETFLFSIFNVLILFLILKFILFKPVTKIMDERSEKIRKNIEDANNSKQEAESLKEKYVQQINNVKNESEQIINEARKKAQAEASEILSEAKKRADEIVEKARHQGEKEVQDALQDVKNQVTSLALQAASRVIQKNMDNETNKKLVEEFIDEVGAA